MENDNKIVEDGTFSLKVSRPPEVVVAEAQKCAAVLKDVISKKGKPVVFNGEQYIEFEDWQTVGKFYGITAKVVSSTFVQYGNASGFESRAVAIDVNTGIEISAAEAMCLNDEDKWSKRAKYEWQKIGNENVKTKVGDEPVPLFQLKSMSQTRACAKCLRNVLSWVVVLAGYKPTPAEEMGHNEATGNSNSNGHNEESPYRMMAAKFDSKCALCNGEIKKGTDIAYNGKEKKAYHIPCLANLADKKEEKKPENKEMPKENGK